MCLSKVLHRQIFKEQFEEMQDKGAPMLKYLRPFVSAKKTKVFFYPAYYLYLKKKK